MNRIDPYKGIFSLYGLRFGAESMLLLLLACLPFPFQRNRRSESCEDKANHFTDFKISEKIAETPVSSSAIQTIRPAYRTRFIAAELVQEKVESQ